MLGVLASVGLVSKLVTRPTAASVPVVTGEAASVKVNVEPRAVVRAQDSL